MLVVTSSDAGCYCIRPWCSPTEVTPGHLSERRYSNFTCSDNIHRSCLVTVLDVLLVHCRCLTSHRSGSVFAVASVTGCCFVQCRWAIQHRPMLVLVTSCHSTCHVKSNLYFLARYVIIIITYLYFLFFSFYTVFVRYWIFSTVSHVKILCTVHFGLSEMYF